MNRIEDIRQRRQHAHRQLLDAKSKVYEAFLAMEKAAYTDGALPRKTKELIAIGISVVIDCESCMEWHITQRGSAATGTSMRRTQRRAAHSRDDLRKRTFFPEIEVQAARAGATRAEVLEAVEVGIEMGGGPATVSARFALEAMEVLLREPPAS
jgi:AhpD family alkylhydroperoxidase